MVFNGIRELSDFSHSSNMFMARIKNLGCNLDWSRIGMTLKDEDCCSLISMECTHDTLSCPKSRKCINGSFILGDLCVQLVICSKQDAFRCIDSAWKVYHQCCLDPKFAEPICRCLLRFGVFRHDIQFTVSGRKTKAGVPAHLSSYGLTR